MPPLGIPEDREVLLGWISEHIAKRLLPERQHGGKVIAVDHDRSDVHVNLLADDPITPNCA